MNRHHAHQANTADDDIDLGLLLARVVKIFKRNLIVILLSVIFGLLCGITYLFATKPKYETSMIIGSKILTKENITNLIQSLQELIDDGNYALLASRLEINNNAAKSVSKIVVEELDKDVPEPDGEEPVFLEIVVRVTDTDLLSQLEGGIIKFLEDNRYVDQRITISRNKYKMLISKTQNEINQIDSLKYQIGEGLVVKSQTPNILMMEPVNIYMASVALFEKKQIYIEKLELTRGIHLLNGFIAFKKPASPKLMVCITTGLALGLVLATIVVFLAETGIYLKKLNKEYYS